ncbi:hypothetical protein [Microbispora rosea]|uniref:hypothetical protein n=1 Tax=Microbispora rosea TaxID=58117 RepID=UPI0004C3C88C|nr:hypothetical protein [Microbispora rosea]
MSDGEQRETFRIDVGAYARELEKQRNDLLHEATQLRVAVDQLLGEREELRRQLAEVKGEPAAA